MTNNQKFDGCKIETVRAPKNPQIVRMERLLAGRTDDQIREDYRTAWKMRDVADRALDGVEFGTDDRRHLAAEVDALNLSMTALAHEMNRRGWGNEGRAYRLAVVEGRV